VPPTTSEHLEQDNVNEHAPEEEVVQCFDTLITEGAHDAILQAMPVMPIVHTLFGALVFHNSLAPKMADWPMSSVAYAELAE
jgi:hypothetical protein